jgi:hypothetical protein
VGAEEQQIRQDVVTHHHPLQSDSYHNSLDQSFFERTSTSQYIEELAALATADPICIYAGAGVSADIGAPLYEELMPWLLHEFIREHPDLTHEGSNVKLDTAYRLSAALSGAYAPAYLGSITREIARSLSPIENPYKNGIFASRIHSILRKGRRPGGFLARGVTALAFSVLRARGTSKVLTTNYEGSIVDEAQSNLVRYLPELADYSFHTITHYAGVPGVVPANRVPLYYLNGKLDDSSRLVIGESDFFAWYDHQLTQNSEHHRWRSEVISTALSEGTCLFVGSGLTDPDLLAQLATTKSDRRKYAILLAPPIETADTQRKDRHLLRDLVERRFLHLGIVPITVDYPHQVPQFLREVALRVRDGNGYRPYICRLNTWWQNWHHHLGYSTPNSVAGARSFDMQNAWRILLEELLASSEVTSFLGGGPANDEQVQIEVWLRNPDPGQRRIFLWANSDCVWLNGASAHVASLRLNAPPEYLAQRTFRSGHIVTEELPANRGHWRFCVSIPLVLHAPDWHHLPIGVLNVLGNQAPPIGERHLASPLVSLARDTRRLEAFEGVLKRTINYWLDANNLGDLLQLVSRLNKGEDVSFLREDQGA